ncbi:ABC transporter permease [Sharpea azabuensis]|jgi:spermidine/putrescine transport system permease protein|uniref:ABC transporter permease n=1 Tax=Sharpea porci TaxID=2652286 RepID=A0A844FVC9_9FIRM|nr:ABC transporter permease [Sharpea porci]MST89887.1 ABC transporter permease [Sharpea porci]
MKKFKQLVIPYIVWSILMLLLPMLLIAMYSFMKQGNSILPFKLTIHNYVKFFTDKDFLLILLRSLLIAVKTTIICLLLGYPLAYFIAKTPEKKRNNLILLITLPMWINMLVRTYAWIGLLSNDGLFAWIFSLLGFKHVELLYTETAVLIGMVYNFLPFMILQINTALTKIDPSLIEASYDLGASKKETFRRVILPLSLSGVISGIALVFLPAVSSFFIPKLLGGGQYFLIGNVIENQFITVGEWNFGSAISMIMAVIMMLSMYAVRRIDSNNHQQEDE